MSHVMRRWMVGLLFLTIAPVRLSSQASHIQSSSTLPANCTVGNVYVKTGTSAGFYVCATTDTWTGPLSTSTGTVTVTGSPASGNLTKFSGASSITNADLTGDVTTSGGVATTIPNDTVTYAKMQNVSAASRLLCRGSASGSGDPQECTVGTGLSLSGTTLSATASSAWSALTDPSGNLSLSHAANTTAFTWGSSTSTSNLFTLADTSSNTGTGYLFSVTTASSSTLKPFRVQWRANDRLTVDGSGRIKLNGNRADAEYDAGNSSTSLTLDWDNGNQQIVTLTGNVTFTLSNPQVGGAYRLIIVQGSGPYTITWPSSVKWENDTAPTITTTNGKVVFCQLIYTSLGADGYLGFCTTNPISQP
jgi:Repeat of unknown function (DUF5907)